MPCIVILRQTENCTITHLEYLTTCVTVFVVLAQLTIHALHLHLLTVYYLQIITQIVALESPGFANTYLTVLFPKGDCCITYCRV